MKSKKIKFSIIFTICLLLLSAPMLETFAQRGRRGGGGHHGGHSRHHAHHHHHMHHHMHMHPHMMWHPHAFWHPVGFFLVALATTAIIVAIVDDNDNDVHGEEVYYDQGTYYHKSADGYKVVGAPAGAIVSKLPDDYSTVQIKDNVYYYYGGDYYVDYKDGKYKVVNAPVGASVAYLPDGYETKEIDDKTYFVYNGTWYEAKSSGDDVVYLVGDKPAY